MTKTEQNKLRKGTWKLDPITNVNYVLIRLDGRTVTGLKGSFYEAAAEIRKMLRDPFYNRPDSPIKKIFLSDGEYLSEYEASEIEDESNWTVGK
jgi:hypothetical protein